MLMLARDPAVIDPFTTALSARGYVDGRNVQIAYAFADGHPERLGEAASALVERRPDVIFSFSGEAAPVVKRMAGTIPVVVAVSNDPVRSGLVASLARPGGNVTGVTFVYDELAGKTLELLKEAAPRITRVSIVWNPDHADPEFRGTQAAARVLGVDLQSVVVHDVQDFYAAFEAILAARSEAMVVVWSRVVAVNRQRIADFARKQRILFVGSLRFWAELGALLTYGPDLGELVSRCAIYVDKILRGAHPADLPMQQPTAFQLVINRRAAREHGLVLSPSLMARADEVID